MKIIAAITLLIVASVACQAQRTDLPKHFTYEGRLFKIYDRFEDKTTYSVSGVPVLKQGDLELDIGVGATVACLSKPESLPENVAFFVAVISKTPVLARDARLLAIVDGERKEIGGMSEVGSDDAGGSSLIMYGARLAGADLRKLAFAKKVEMRFDGVEFELNGENRRALMDFINALVGTP